MNLPSGWEWILVILLALIIFGPRRLPELMRGLGDGVREFKKAMNGQTKTPDEETKSAPPPASNDSP